MSNLSVSLKRFLKNKNTVTILGIVIILVLLYVVYSAQIKSAVDPVKIPVAKETIQPREEVTADNVDLIDVPAVAVTDNVYRYKKDVIGKYANVNSVIPQGSMFYKDTLVDKKELPDSAFTEVKEGEIVYNFPVNMSTTYGNSIFPGNKIDIYMKAVEDSTGKVMVGKLVENVTVLAVKDAQGRHVFEDTSERRTPATLIFGVPSDINNLLRKAYYLESIDVELFPVPHGGTASSEGDVNVTAAQLKSYIEAHTVNVQLDEADDLTTNNDKATDSAVGDSTGSNADKTNDKVNNQTNNTTGAR